MIGCYLFEVGYIKHYYRVVKKLYTYYKKMLPNKSISSF